VGSGRVTVPSDAKPAPGEIAELTAKHLWYLAVITSIELRSFSHVIGFEAVQMAKEFGRRFNES
jgi:hypothetical protein